MIDIYTGGGVYPLAIRTLTGLEDVLAAELRALGARKVKVGRRLVNAEGDKTLLYRANYHLRTAIRVLLPLSSFRAQDEKDLYQAVMAIDWRKWLQKDSTLAVNAIVQSSNLTHSLFVEQHTKDAIVDQFRHRYGQRPSVDLNNPDLRISIYINKNEGILYLDSSGDSLHKRGYRSGTHAAPLNEVLAAGIIGLSGWAADTTRPFVDGMCGSGTFLIEAGMLARNLAPGSFGREYGFMHWPDFDSDRLEQIRAKAAADTAASTTICTICGTEVNKKTLAIAKKNVENAGLSEHIQIRKRAFEDTPPPPEAGTLIMNPPYGERLEIADIEAKYKLIGDTLKQHYAGYTAWVFTGNREAAKRIGLRPTRRVPLYNGKIDCRLLKFDMYAGSRREK